MRMATAADERVEFRIDPESKRQLEEAALIEGISVSALARSSAVRRAEATIAAQRRIELDDADWLRLRDVLDRPAEVNERLLDLLRRPDVFGG